MTQTEFLKDCLATSYIQLLEKKEKDKISVQEICQQAGVSRPTYYRHFYEKDEVLLWKLAKLVAELDEEANQYEKDDFRNRWLLVFEFFPRNRDFFDILKKQNLLYLIEQTVAKYIEESDDRDPKYDFHYSFISHGMGGIISRWIREDYKTDKNELVDLIFDFLVKA